MLRFCKIFEKTDDAVNFYLATSKLYFKIDSNDVESIYYIMGKKINFRLSLNGNIVYLDIEDQWKVYNNSLMFSYDYDRLYQQFKDIDNDYSYRGIKFGSNLSTIKTITKLDNYKFGDKFTFLPKDEKFLFIKLIYFLIY